LGAEFVELVAALAKPRELDVKKDRRGVFRFVEAYVRTV